MHKEKKVIIISVKTREVNQFEVNLHLNFLRLTETTKKRIFSAHLHMLHIYFRKDLSSMAKEKINKIFWDLAYRNPTLRVSGFF